MMGTTAGVIIATLAHATLLGTVAPVRVHDGRNVARATSMNDSLARAARRVSRVSVGPAEGGAEIVIAGDPGVAVRHFTLDGPARLVVDLGGASLALRGTYDGQTRGPVRNVRLSQYRSDTVRIVVDLDASRQYSVSQVGAEVRVSVSGPSVAIAKWEARGAESAEAPRMASSRMDESARVVPASPRPDAAPASAPAKVVEAPAARTVSAAGSLAEQTRELSAEAVRPAAPAVTLTATPIAAPTEKLFTRPANSSRALVQPAQPQPKPRISIQFDNTDIRDVIATFATFSGRSIIAGKDVVGTITGDIRDKPWDVALQALLQGQGLAATEDAAGIITVDSYKNLASNQALEPLVTQIVNVNYAKASTLENTVRALLARDCTALNTMATGRDAGMPMNQGMQPGQNNMMSGQGCVVRGSVSADSATNKLIITEVPSRLPEIISRLQELDIRTPQVAIKAKIIFVNRTGITDIGLAYDLGKGNEQFFQQLVPRTDPSTLTPVDTDGDGVPDALGGGSPFQGPARISLGGKSFSGIANANNAIKPNALNLIYSASIGKYQLTSFLNALQTSSLADVQSEPSVTILNNRTATIFVGQEIPIRVIDASAGGAAGGGGGGGGGAGGGAQGQPNAAAFFPRAAVSKEEAGIKLTVSPQITNNKQVLLDIQAENSSAELANSDVGVIFNRQRADSKVLVADGEAAVIGGLTVTETTKFRSGIPFLMDLPFIGRIFSQNSKNETKRDLLILVTPHILEDGASAPPPER